MAFMISIIATRFGTGEAFSLQGFTFLPTNLSLLRSLRKIQKNRKTLSQKYKLDLTSNLSSWLFEGSKSKEGQ